MTRTLLIGVAWAMVAACVAGGAEQTVTLPYMSPDKDGNQWMVTYYGYLQQQGNMPVYSSTGVMTINGASSSGRIVQRQAKQDTRTGELILDNLTIGGFSITRRFQFNKDDGYVRIIDIVRNTSGREQQAQIGLNANANYGVQSGQVIADAKKKGQNLAWVGATSANNRAIVEIFNGPKAKTPLAFDYQPGNSNITANLTVTVPANKDVALMHFHAVANTANDGAEFVKKFNVSKAMRDIPGNIRRILLNFTSGATFFGDYEVLRGDLFDILEMRTGDQFRGTVKEGSFKIATFYGPMDVPAERINGIVSIGAIRPRQLLFTADGDILGGSIEKQTITFELSDGQSMQVPLAQVARIGWRKRANEPDEIAADKPYVLMRTGERMAIRPPTEPFLVHTRFGAMKLKPEMIAQILFQNEEHAVHEIHMTDGTRLTALVDAPQVEVKLAASEQAIKFPLTTAAKMVIKPENPDQAPEEAPPQLKLANEELLVGVLSGKMQLDTGFSMLALDAEGIRALSRVKESAQDVQVTLWDETSFRGQLQEPAVSCLTRCGLEVKVPLGLVEEYVNPLPRPSTQMISKVKQLIGQLNADDFATRQRAQESLAGMGPLIIPVLKEMRGSQSEEAQGRIDHILAGLEKKK